MFWFLPVVCPQEMPATNYKILVGTSIKMGRTKRDSVIRKTYVKFPQIFIDRTVYICDMRKSKKCFWAFLDILGEINFQSKLRLRASNFFVWKLLFRQKKKVEGGGAFRKFWWSGAKTFSGWSKSQNTLQHGCYGHYSQWASMEKVPYDCSMSPHLTVPTSCLINAFFQ